MQDPPSHTEFRKLVSRGFTPRQVEAVEPKVSEFVVQRIEKPRADGGGDIVTELFKPLRSLVVAHYLGVPEEDWAQKYQGPQDVPALRCTATSTIARRCASRTSTGKLGREIAARTAAVEDPRERLIESILVTLAMVRESPALSSWFATTRPPVAGELAGESDVIAALATAFLHSLGRDDPAAVQRRARWTVRVIISLLMYPDATPTRKTSDDRRIRRPDHGTRPRSAVSRQGFPGHGSGHPIGLRLDRFVWNAEILPKCFGHRAGGATVASHPAEVVTRVERRRPYRVQQPSSAVRARHPGDVGARRHRQVPVLVATGL